MIGGVHVIVVAQHMSCPLLVYGIHTSTHGTDQKLCLQLTPPLDNKILQSNSKQRQFSHALYSKHALSNELYHILKHSGP